MSEQQISKEGEPHKLLLAIVQAQDVDSAAQGLAQIGISVTRLPSIGGFLGRRNVTLMVSTPEGLQDKAKEVLNQNCRQRVEYIAVPLESAPLPLPAPTPVTIGGATIFGLEIDHFEEF